MTSLCNLNEKYDRNIAIDLLKLFTMLLIINSHSDVLYPSKISFFASGGGIGNELFFLISGFLFSLKADIKKNLLKRFIKLYVPTYIMILITFAFGKIYVNVVRWWMGGG